MRSSVSFSSGPMGEKSPLSVVGNIAGVRAIPYVVRVVIQRLFLLGKDEWR